MPIRAAVVSAPTVSHLSPVQAFQRANPELWLAIEHAREEWRLRLNRLRTRQRRSQHHEVRRLLRTQHLYPMFAFEALRRSRRLSSASAETALRLAGRFNPFVPVVEETVLIREIGSGAYSRKVQDFGPVRRMHQIAVDGILRSLHPLREQQKLLNGGMPKALEAIEGAYRSGMSHGCEVDLINFYGSVRFADLPELMRPLPQSVTQHVVWDTALREHSHLIRSRITPTPEMPDGLSLGSATSPIVGEVIIKKLLAAAQLTEVVTYADNLFVLGRSESEIMARLQRLEDSIASADFGVSGLSFRPSPIFRLRDGFEFANHRGRPTEGSGFEWSPGDRRVSDFQISAADHVTVPQLERAMTQVANWRRYYSSWPDGDRYEAEYLAGLKVRRYLIERTPLNCTDAVSAVVDAYYLWEGLKHPEEFLSDYDYQGTTRVDPVGELMSRIQFRLQAVETARQRRREGEL